MQAEESGEGLVHVGGKTRQQDCFPGKLLIMIQPCSTIGLKVILLIVNLPVTRGNSGTMD